MLTMMLFTVLLWHGSFKVMYILWTDLHPHASSSTSTFASRDAFSGPVLVPMHSTSVPARVQARNKKACRSQTNAGSQCTPCTAATYVSTPVVLFGVAVTYASIHVPAACDAAAASF